MPPPDVIDGSPGQALVAALHRAGIDLAVSLPDSWLTPVLTAVEEDGGIEHVRVAREDDGVGVCAGAWLGGRRAVLLCQNAGLLLAANVLAGMAHHHQIPVLAVAADRGGIDDGFYYQAYKGRVSTRVLDAVDVPWHRIDTPAGLASIPAAYTQAELHRRPVVVLAAKAALLGPPAETPGKEGGR